MVANKTISQEEARSQIESKAKKVLDKDVKRVLNEVPEKLKKVDPGRFRKFINQVKLLLEMVGDWWNDKYTEIPWFTIAAIVAALIYFLSPVDLIPDVIPGLGYVDDALVVGACILLVEEDLRKYCAFKGYDAAQYF